MDPENLTGCSAINIGQAKTDEDLDDDEYVGKGKINGVSEWGVDLDQSATKILLVDRGSCSFVDKVRNGERAGASLVVVIDNRLEDISDVIMGDDGTGLGIRIPSMLIGRDSGAILREYALASSDEPAVVSAEFTMAAPDDVVEIELWYSSNNQLALDFIKEFDKYIHDLQDFVDFSPKFVTWACPACSKSFK